MGSIMKYTISPITMKCRGEILEFLRKFYYKDEPLLKSCSCLNNPDQHGFWFDLDQYVTKPLNQGLSLKAVSSDGKLMGVQINHIQTRKDHFHRKKEHENFRNPDSQKIMRLYTELYCGGNLFDKFPEVDRVLELWLSCLDNTYRGAGLAQKLVKETENMAREHNCQAIYADCTGAFSSRGLERLGYNLVYNLPYSQHLDSHGKPVFTPESPHVAANSYVSWLEKPLNL